MEDIDLKKNKSIEIAVLQIVSVIRYKVIFN